MWLSSFQLQEIFDEKTGKWTFHKKSKSKKLVPSSEEYSDHARSRSFKMLNPESEPFELQPSKEGECECGVNEIS